MPIKQVRIVRYLFMNTLQILNSLSVKRTGGLVNAATSTVKDGIQKADNAVVANDRYSASSANDEVVAKVLSLSINKSVDQSVRVDANNEIQSPLSERFEQVNEAQNGLFSIETVTNNVVNFVGRALSNMAANGFDSAQLDYFRNQAKEGVEVGIGQAKLELVGIADDDLFSSIDKTKDAILSGINKLSVDPSEYAANAQVQKSNSSGTQNSYSSIAVNTNNHDSVKVDFESLAFNSAQGLDDKRSMFTSNASNISFSIEGELSDAQANKIANLVNQVDSLTNAFYRSDIESAYTKAIDAGYSNNEIASLARQLGKVDSSGVALAYGEIQHMNKQNAEASNSAPKAVAEYLNKYLDLMDSSKSTLEDKKDFNEIINGIVNQMKDVQVPDLLNAINRFHAFNNKLTQ